MDERLKLAGRKVKIAVRSGASPDDIQKTLAQIYELSGCLACGFLGFDVIFYGVDPAYERLNVSERLAVTVGH